MIKTYSGVHVLEELNNHWLVKEDADGDITYNYRILNGTLYKAFYRHNKWHIDKSNVDLNYFLSGEFEVSDDRVNLSDRFVEFGGSTIRLKEVTLTEMLSTNGLVYGEGEKIDVIKKHYSFLQNGLFYFDDLLKSLGETYTSAACKKALLETKWFMEVK
ncbi:hypothetical protein D307_gp177 [Bacillus phage Bastille]|uniref:Uncharacterized protein n=6 Tax=Bastillevirus TaxID=1918010 RepID=A0A024B122_9CAUD|nr:hypothetical protein D307_gp177 [Bacillus phage Bastille]YP_009035349.1 hypothetical protein FP73_gp189 [Bacillus phage Hoody T]YP_009035678.1 hypothetical protein FP76_gp213 [Bacillus phage Evoli]YP_009037056.1 hypothetical protein FP74_gp206 [Bacillus phage CAM003]AMW61910.1 hypothetical protein DNAM5_166 [Bacillus phage Vinny]ASU01007.1 hypothetical protein ANTHONY_167 [Bacillus phage Anthony]AEQ34287.1 hypothetical protein [Bacillus phage Bastille]AHZ09590.1 hypothetical protein [Baci